jgi:hypothetical protein
MTFRRSAPVLIALVVMFVGAPGARAEGPPGPGWALTARTYPTNLVTPVNEVQQVAVSAEGGTFTLTYREGETTHPIPYLASTATVQSELEALPGIGGGYVRVTGGPEGGVSKPYIVEFINTLGNMQVRTLEASGAGLTGSAPSATVEVSTLGSASGTVAIDVFNVGAGNSEGTITVTDKLPAGVHAREAGEMKEESQGFGEDFGIDPTIHHEQWDCSGNATVGPSPHVAGATEVTCTNDPVNLPVLDGGGGLPALTLAEGANRMPPIAISVEAAGEANGSSNEVSIVGGGAATSATTHDPIAVGGTPTSDLAGWDAWFSNADGTFDTQAGSHPYEATFSYDISTGINNRREADFPNGEQRNVEVQLPPGLVGDTNAVGQCDAAQLHAARCPQDSQVGIAAVNSKVAADVGVRVYNMVPPSGVPAELAFGLPSEQLFGHLDSSVRSGGDYGLTTRANDNVQKETIQVILTLWDESGDPSHNRWRNGAYGGCSQEEIERNANPSEPDYCLPPQNPRRKPFLTLPTACGEPQPLLIRVSTWQHPSVISELNVPMHNSNGMPVGFTGCEALTFEPSISTSPDTAKADTPAGFTFEVRPPLGGLEEPGALGSSDIENTTVALPPGLVINPGQAAGLQACPAGRPSPSEHRYGDALTTEAEKEKGEEDDEAAYCPNASKVGTVVIKSPLIEGAEEKQFEGNVYVLQSNPPELKLLAAASADGVNLKLVGTAHLCEDVGEVIASKTCEASGQLVTTFERTPQLPSALFKLSFSGGAQAALDTPAQCGSYATNADFMPWSSPFIPDFDTSASFNLVEGPNGSACPSSPLPFSPTLVAGSTTDQAGGFTNFSLLLERGDGQQRIERLQFKAPSGLAGLISQVPLCPEPQAAAGTCSEASKIGHGTVASGPGPYPLVIPQPGEPESPIYLTGPYQGAPFGLSIVTHVLAGPFNLGTIVTRARIEIDPHTAQITVTTDPLPQVVDGVPTDLRLINSVIDRPGFMFNPTNCSSQEFSGTAYGTPPPSEGGPHAQAAISSHFGVGSCRELGFSPDFKASTSGRTSKAKGASLDVKVQYPSTPPGGGRVTSQANIASVKVELPKQLPSRLTTLQKACTAAQFASNPAGCPAASIVGHAVVYTPVLPVPLEGPAYFVSNGGEAFPNLIMVLQGYGVTVELVGDTFINKQGITSSTFKSTPDVPFSSFELNLPEGPFSALAANANLCAPTKAKTVKKRVTIRRRGRTVHLVRKVKQLVPESLLMPTTIIGQNGAEIHQSTKISVEGCTRKKTTKKKVKGRVRHGRKKGRR